MAPRTVGVREERKRHVVVYTDACEEGQDWGIGGKMLVDGREETFHGQVPGRTRRRLDGRLRYIAVLESMAVLVAMAVWSSEL